MCTRGCSPVERGVLLMLYTRPVPPKTLTAFRIDQPTLDALKLVKERDGLPITFQVQKALEAWLRARGVKVVKDKAAQDAAHRRAGESAQKRTATRKRS